MKLGGTSATDSSLLKIGRPLLDASVWELPMTTTTITHAIISVDVLEGLSRVTARFTPEAAI
jgi:hypothetical protein